jgi:GrpB-like predicted nucleotidyltransferase (UPF0157 family)
MGIAVKRQIRIEITDYDRRWPKQFETHAAVIAKALGDAAVQIEHIGSTAVPALAAKAIVDILLVVADSGVEAIYRGRLEAAGYELRIAEPEFHQHRMFSTPERDVHLHVYSLGSAEVSRLLRFRDQLRGNVEDRRTYEETKRRLARAPWPNMDAYAQAKTAVIERILAAKH